MEGEGDFRSSQGLGSSTMDERLIEVFGCVSLDAMMTDKERIRDTQERVLLGGTMDEALIEVFGCVSLDKKVVWLDTGKERKAGRAGLRHHPVVARTERGLRLKYH